MGVLLVAATLTFASPAHAATTTISARFDRTSADVNQARTLSGTVTPKTAARSVRIQRYSGGKWIDYKTASVSSSTGRYSATVKLGTPGNYRFRVASPHLSISSSSVYLRIWYKSYLADRSSVFAGCYGTLWHQSVNISGKTYAHSLVWSNGGSYCVEYDLGKKYERFVTVVGIADDSGGTVASTGYRVLADNVVIASGTASRGAPATIDVSVKGRLRLRLEVSYGSGTGTYQPAWANASIKR